jgi:UDP-N-acetylmuramate: L-alanyl-gamma-D-glutamyl-meso-diaminopimelate ligase
MLQGETIRSVHFIGICGVAMSQVAAWLASQGVKVTGSDEGVYPPMSDFLQSRGIPVLTPYRSENLEAAETVVIGNALSRGNPEVETVLEKRLPFLSLPELIHTRLLRERLPIVVSGTHGKTTTSAALAHILREGGLSPGYMIGGLPIGWDSGFDAGSGRWFVIEGDEYDSAFFDKRPKFLHYQPQVVILNNIEFDHADIYASLDELFLQFRRLIQLLPKNGLLLANADESNLEPLLGSAPCAVRTFGLHPSAMIRSQMLEITAEGMKFRLRFASGEERVCATTLWGQHQLQNLTAAAAAAEYAGVSPDAIPAAVAGFRGVRRRLELKFRARDVWLYEDFAHHPTAVKAALSSLKVRHPNARIVAAFEPRSNTMARNFFQSEIVEALSIADKIAVGAVHRKERIPARERLDTERIAEELRRAGKAALASDMVEEIVEFMLQKPAGETVWIYMTNGAFSGLPERILDALQRRYEERIQ